MGEGTAGESSAFKKAVTVKWPGQGHHRVQNVRKWGSHQVSRWVSKLDSSELRSGSILEFLMREVEWRLERIKRTQRNMDLGWVTLAYICKFNGKSQSDRSKRKEGVNGGTKDKDTLRLFTSPCMCAHVVVCTRGI